MTIGLLVLELAWMGVSALPATMQHLCHLTHQTALTPVLMLGSAIHKMCAGYHMGHFLTCFLKLLIWNRVTTCVGCTLVSWGYIESVVGSVDAHGKRGFWHWLWRSSFKRDRSGGRERTHRYTHGAHHDHVNVGHSDYKAIQLNVWC